MKSQCAESTAVYFDTLDYDYDFQAMVTLLQRMDRDDHQLARQVVRAREVAERSRGEQNELAVDRLIELYEYSSSQDATHSVAAVGLIASYLESLFRGIYKFLKKEWPRDDLVKNIIDVVKETGLIYHFPSDLESILKALFEYRNRILHYNSEWPTYELNNFARKLDDSDWPVDWFEVLTSGGEPVMIYMTQTFIDHCLDTIRQIWKGFEVFQTDEFRHGRCDIEDLVGF